MFLKSTLKHCS